MAAKPSTPAVFPQALPDGGETAAGRRAAARRHCSIRCGTEVESLLVLKNNRGVEGNRMSHGIGGVQINKLMYTRLLKGGDITLFSPSDVPAIRCVLRRPDEFGTPVREI